MSNAALPGDFREVLQRRLGELERQLLRKVAELEDEKSLLHNETAAHRQKTESTLNALLHRVSELERGGCPASFLASLWPLPGAPPDPPHPHPDPPALNLILGCSVQGSWARSKGGQAERGARPGCSRPFTDGPPGQGSARSPTPTC